MPISASSTDKVRLTTLANGLRVVSEEIPGVHSTVVGIWIGVGARDEPAEQNGCAHFLEHMMFKGTTTRDARKIAEEIEAVGGYLNAATGRETTTYYCQVLPEDMELAVDILVDMVVNSLFDETELEREKQVVLQEIAQIEDSPEDQLFDLIQHQAWPNQGLGRPILGLAASVSTLSADDLRQFVKTNYVTHNIVVSAAGRVDHDRLIDIIQDKLIKHQATIASTPASTRQLAQYQGGTLQHSQDNEQINLAVGYRSLAITDPRFATQEVLATLVGGGMSSRLFQTIREQEGLAYAISSFVSAYRETGMFGVFAATSPDLAHRLVTRLAKELHDLRDGFEPDEVSRAKAQLRAGRLMARDSVSHRARWMASDLLIFGHIRDENDILASLARVNCDALQGMWHELSSEPISFAAIGPLAAASDIESALSLISP